MKKTTLMKTFNDKKKNTNKEKVAVYPGSFAPFHFGHLLVVKAALAYYDKLIILVAHNPNKENDLFVADTYKRNLIEKVIISENIQQRVQVDVLETGGKVVNYLQAANVDTLVRGF